MAAAKALNLTRSALQARLARAEAAGIVAGERRQPRDELHIPTPPPKNETIKELLARRKALYTRRQTHDEFMDLVPIDVKMPGPVAICAVGDPHVDDDGCDLAGIERDMTLIGKTKGMYALHLGDITNNWVGRLGRLYAHQTTTAEDGIRLAEWMFDLAPPLAVVGGNHDVWNEGMSWLNFCLKQAGVQLVQTHGIRLELRFPRGQSVRVHARHDFPGNSQFNPLHGLRKEHLFGFRDHINIAGHRHTDSIAAVPSPDGYIQWMFRVSGYKAFDDYAKSGNMQRMKMGPTVAMVIDPATRHVAELVKPFWDLDEAADFLTFKRKRAA
jgi:hypothetical protein